MIGAVAGMALITVLAVWYLRKKAGEKEKESKAPPNVTHSGTPAPTSPSSLPAPGSVQVETGTAGSGSGKVFSPASKMLELASLPGTTLIGDRDTAASGKPSLARRLSSHRHRERGVHRPSTVATFDTAVSSVPSGYFRKFDKFLRQLKARYLEEQHTEVSSPHRRHVTHEQEEDEVLDTLAREQRLQRRSSEGRHERRRRRSGRGKQHRAESRLRRYTSDGAEREIETEEAKRDKPFLEGERALVSECVSLV